jgi:signal transduction histidine kinase
MLTGWWLVAAAVATAVGTAGLVAALWRHRDKPGAGWFLASLTCQTLWAVTYGVALLTFTPPLRRALGGLSTVFVVGMGAYFVAFALEYTGRGALRGRPVGVVVALVPVALLVAVATNGVHGLLWAPSPPVVTVAGLAGVARDFRPATQAVAGLGVGAVVVGSLLLFDTVVSYGPLYRREAVAVGLSPVAPMTAIVVWLFELGPVTAITFAPLFFLVHVALDAYAFVGSDMFEFHPATRRTGERAAIDDLGAPVIVVDEHGRVVTANDAAGAVLGVDRAALTEPLSAHLDDDLDYREGGEVTVRVDGTPRRYSVTATPLAVDDDRVGYTLTWQDVTEARRREQRLAVLNRALRHNLRNDMTVVRGFTESARDRVEDPAVADMLDTALGRTDDLVALGETARDVERTLEGDPHPEPVALDSLVETTVDHVAPPGTVAVDAPPVTVETDRETVRTVLAELVENAVEHGTPEAGGPAAGRGTADGGVVAGRAPVRVRVEPRAETVDVVVADDGPGVPAGELSVVTGGEETALEHGSGLGLWLARWGAERIGADLSFDTEDGTTGRLSLPRRGSTTDGAG